jgi:tRNA(Ile)-lysidine synthase
MTRVLDRVRRSIEENRLLPRGEAVVVGVSGGIDSLCLLHALCRLRREYELLLHVGHLHHGLRGTDADADAEFVRGLAQDWGLACAVEEVDVRGLAEQSKLSIEEAARRARYAFLAEVAEAVGARTIAVGHNADDQAETVLMHFVRGSGLAGLRGMLPSAPVGEYCLVDSLRDPPRAYDLQLIRPLLEVTRAEIEAYCDFYGLEPRFDRSNLDTTFFRNWLRHEVFPLLARHNPNIGEVMRRSARVIADDYALLRDVLEDTWERVVLEEETRLELASSWEGGSCGRIVFDRDTWRALPTSLQRSTLREAIHRLRRSLRNISFVHVENALSVARDGTTGDQATLPQGLVLRMAYERFSVADAKCVEPLPCLPLLAAGETPVPVRVPGQTLLPGMEWVLEAEVGDRGDLAADWAGNADPWQAFLDADAAGASLWLRTRRPGDRFQPHGMGGHWVKLGDFLTNQKVPRYFRDLLPLLEGERGIAWVCGQRLDERVRVRAATKRVLTLRFRHLDGPEEEEVDDRATSCWETAGGQLE